MEDGVDGGRAGVPRPSLERLDVRLRTDRLVVRTLRPEDVGSGYAAWFEDPVVQRFIEWRPSGDAIEELRTFVASHDVRADSLLLGVFTADGHHVANLKYEPVDVQQGTAVLGVLVGAPEWRGRGLFTEVFSVTADLLRQEFGIRRVLLGVDSENAAALAAYERSGFRRIDRPGSTALWMECRLA